MRGGASDPVFATIRGTLPGSGGRSTASPTCRSRPWPTSRRTPAGSARTAPDGGTITPRPSAPQAPAAAPARPPGRPLAPWLRPKVPLPSDRRRPFARPDAAREPPRSAQRSRPVTQPADHQSVTAELTAPVEQQVGVEVMAARSASDRGVRLIGKRNRPDAGACEPYSQEAGDGWRHALPAREGVDPGCRAAEVGGPVQFVIPASGSRARRARPSR
jgi:hypothetical protein